jgi:hypothetical protein
VPVELLKLPDQILLHCDRATCVRIQQAISLPPVPHSQDAFRLPTPGNIAVLSEVRGRREVPDLLLSLPLSDGRQPARILVQARFGMAQWEQGYLTRIPFSFMPALRLDAPRGGRSAPASLHHGEGLTRCRLLLTLTLMVRS